MPTQASLVGELSIRIPNVIFHALAQGLVVLGKVSVDMNSRNDEIERVTEERDRFLE